MINLYLIELIEDQFYIYTCLLRAISTVVVITVPSTYIIIVNNDNVHKLL